MSELAVATDPVKTLMGSVCHHGVLLDGKVPVWACTHLHEDSGEALACAVAHKEVLAESPIRHGDCVPADWSARTHLHEGVEGSWLFPGQA